MKITTFLLAGLSLTSLTVPASAQIFGPGGPFWDDRPTYRRAPPPPPSYDDRYYEPGDDGDDDVQPRRAVRPVQRGYGAPPVQRGYGAPAQRGYQNPDEDFGYPGERDRGHYDADDDVFQPDYEEPEISRGKPDPQNPQEIVSEGGPRPVIAARAPPVVAFFGSYPSNSIVIDSKSRKLYYVLGNATAYAYPIGVGREGFSWIGTEKVSRVAEWPDWHPPAEMRQRQPELPTKMLGGLRNPLGAKAIYLGSTLYRIHGTNDAKSIGHAQSSGCFRMMNEHVTHLASIVQVGTEVSVVKALAPGAVATRGRTAAVR